MNAPSYPSQAPTTLQSVPTHPFVPPNITIPYHSNVSAPYNPAVVPVQYSGTGTSAPVAYDPNAPVAAYDPNASAAAYDPNTPIAGIPFPSTESNDTVNYDPNAQFLNHSDKDFDMLSQKSDSMTSEILKGIQQDIQVHREQDRSDMKSLKDGIETLTSGMTTLTSGMNTLTSGMNTLNGGMTTLTNSMTNLNNGMNRLNGGMNTFNGGMNMLTDTVLSMKNELVGLNQLLRQMITSAGAGNGGLQG
ncbi:hypothetical protein GSI_08354 [Ganoderma sinense ZZ0214-1]|uniref:Uncharacterized protein n=1 Tax=Ganoderma sinense ZZ0214-1 TaxID=1077348 RepID=A0A2G8S6Z9_9APHY|nr:hypothetical protein GSI_08354 [Ganoderma sinense ZZ0214-1]